MNSSLETCGLFWYAEDPYLKILQKDAKKLLAVVEAARKLIEIADDHYSSAYDKYYLDWFDEIKKTIRDLDKE